MILEPQVAVRTGKGPFPPSQPKAAPKRLVLIGVVALINLWVGCLFLAPIRTRPLLDLPQLYFAGKLVLSGNVARIYDTGAYKPLIEAMRRTDPEALRGSLYFNRPAFEAPLFVPLSLLSFKAAKIAALAINVLLVALLVWKLPQWFPVSPHTRVWLFVFMPFLYSVGFGQDTLLLTLLVAAGIHFARKDRQWPAGVLIALAGFKPHLLFLLPLAFAAARRWKLLASFVVAGAVLSIFSFLLVGQQGLSEWIALLRAPTTDFHLGAMGNLRAMALHFGTSAAVAAAAVVLGCLAIVFKRGTLCEQCAIALVAALLLSPHTYAQDYSLLPVAALIAFPRIWLYAILLPWPYFYPSADRDMLPFILLSLVCLVAVAVRGKTPVSAPVFRLSSSSA